MTSIRPLSKNSGPQTLPFAMQPDMLLLSIFTLIFVAAAEELVEEPLQDPCNCTRLLHAEETTTDEFATFPTTSFTCWGRYDGYYADVEVDCTIFHYCQTWQFPTGLNETVKWDFACPQSTIFNQKILSCTPPNISFDCQESPNYYWVNLVNSTSMAESTTPESSSHLPNVGQQLIVEGVGPQSVVFPGSSEATATAADVTTVETGLGSEEPTIQSNESVADVINFPR